jgi:hypothetical protein
MILVVKPNYDWNAGNDRMTLGSLLYAIARGVIGALKLAILAVLKLGRWVWDKARLV